MPRWVEPSRVTFKYGLGEEFIEVLKTLHKLGLDRTAAGHGAFGGRRRGGQPARRGRRLPARPGRARATRMRGKTCAGLLGHRHGQGRRAA